MNCHDVRDLFSALADQALEPLRQGELDRHLAECADCRRELDRFARALGALRGLAPARAPVGFVDRVLGALQPEPWYRGLVRRLFLPLRVKLPLEATALVLAAAAAVFVFERSPELEQAARPQSPAADKESAPPRRKAEDKAAEPPLEKTLEESRAASAPKPSASVPRAPAPLERQDPGKREGRLSSELGAAAKAVAPPAGAGVLAVQDRRAAEAALAELVTRLDGEEVSRRAERDHTVVEILVSGDRYLELAQGLERIGVWTAEREPQRVPRRILVEVRVSE
jgi:hypothetical protein